MFQLWKLVLVCGLLTGTSAFLLENLGKDLNHVVSDLKPVLEEGIETFDNTLDAALQKLLTDLDVSQKLAKQRAQEAESMVDNALFKTLSAEDVSQGMKLSNLQVLDLKFEKTPDSNGFDLRIPITINVTLPLPFANVAKLKASLDILTSVKIKTNARTGLPAVVLEECTINPANISITVPTKPFDLIGRLTSKLTGLLQDATSYLVQKEVCPLLHFLVSILDVDIIQNIITGNPPSRSNLKTEDEEDPVMPKADVRGQAPYPMLKEDESPPQGPVVKPKMAPGLPVLPCSIPLCEHAAAIQLE